MIVKFHAGRDNDLPVYRAGPVRAPTQVLYVAPIISGNSIAIVPAGQTKLNFAMACLGAR